MTYLYKSLTVAAIVFFLASSVQAEDRLWDEDFRELYSDRIKSSVDEGLQWLAEQQNDDGSWTAKTGYKLNESYKGTRAKNVGITGLAGLSFLSAGHFPGRGKYGDVVEDAVAFIIDKTDPDTGYINHGKSRMYEHSFAALFLAEVYGMTGNEEVRDVLRDAVDLIIHAQNQEGGWRYQPRPNKADISVTVTSLQTLRAANNVGISVPRSTIEKAMEYISGCYRRDGAFYYQNRRMSRTSWALTASGIVALQSAGEYESARVERSIEWLWQNVRSNRIAWGSYHYFYGHYYSAQAFYQSGMEQFVTYYEQFANEILPRQQEPGNWTDEVSPVYATSMATLILQIPVRYLPIFQK